jgi:putative ABC transport system permease protein
MIEAMGGLLRDLRFGLRILTRSPGHTLAAVLALALGIGLSTAMFSIVYGALLRGLPFPESERIVHVGNANPSRDQPELEVHVHDYLEYARRQTALEGLAAYDSGTLVLSGDGQPERFSGAFLTANTLDQLRVKPLLGRGFLPGDDAPGAEPVVLLGYGTWKSRYGGDLGVIGRRVRVNSTPGTIVGVMPQRFGFPDSEQAWTTLHLDPLRTPRGQGETFRALGRLKPGATLAQARAEMTAAAKELAAEHPQTNQGLEAVVRPLNEVLLPGEIHTLLYTMLAACLFVLLIACTNVASLLVARASRRTREIAIRSALGAPRRRIVGQLLAESLLLSLGGAVLGVLLAHQAVRLFNAAIVESNPPFWFHIAVDPAALAFAFGTTLLAAVVSGLVPALQASRTDITEVLKDEGRGSTSLRLGLFTRIVVVGEVAFSCLLLVGAGLMIHSVIRTQTMDLGINPRGLLTARISLFETAYPDEASRGAFFDKLTARLRQHPGVIAAAAGDFLPGSGSGVTRYEMPGKSYTAEKDKPLAHLAKVSFGYFQTFGVHLLAGRDFGTLDKASGQPVVIVNRSFARKAWPGQDPLGRQIRLSAAQPGGPEKPWSTIVGVVADAQMARLGSSDSTGPEGLYVPLTQSCPVRVNVIVRTRQGAPLSFLEPLRGVVAELDRDLPLYFVFSMEQVLAKTRFFPNLFGTLFAIFGASALLLASVGIYGVISFSVSQRTQEIGIRMALGAGKRTVLRLILVRGMVQLAAGLAFGLLLAWPAAKLIATTLVGIDPHDPLTFGTVAAVLTLVAFLACWIPAQRAAKTDPLVAIRYD